MYCITRFHFDTLMTDFFPFLIKAKIFFSLFLDFHFAKSHLWFITKSNMVRSAICSPIPNLHSRDHDFQKLFRRRRLLGFWSRGKLRYFVFLKRLFFLFLSFYFIICIFKSNAICRPLELQSFVCCLLECESESPNYFIDG